MGVENVQIQWQYLSWRHGRPQAMQQLFATVDTSWKLTPEMVQGPNTMTHPVCTLHHLGCKFSIGKLSNCQPAHHGISKFFFRLPPYPSKFDFMSSWHVTRKILCMLSCLMNQEELRRNLAVCAIHGLAGPQLSLSIGQWNCLLCSRGTLFAFIQH